MFGRIVLSSALLQLAHAQSCMDPGTFTLLNIDQYSGIRPSVTNNNLGGVGPTTGPQEMRIANVATHNGRRLDLRITALTDYRAANNEVNGFGYQNTGRFGVINIRAPGPVCNGCTGISGLWHPGLTYTDFQVDILDQATGGPVDMTGGFRTFLTFYDFDTLNGNPNLRSIECLSAETPASGNIIIHRDPGSQLTAHTTAEMNTWVDADGSYTPTTRPQGFAGADLYCASQYGTAADNPADPLNLTPLQAARSIHFDMQNVNTIKLRYLLRNGDAATGRNFLFGGRPHVPLCPPPPVVVAADPHFIAAHGDAFDFKGKHETIYNLLSHTALSVNAYFENVDYREAGKNKRLVHGSYMRAVYVTFSAANGDLKTVEYAAKAGKYLKQSVVDAAGTELVAEQRQRLAEGWSKAEEGLSLAFDGKELTISTAEWTVGISNRVKPGIVGASSCATGKCFLEISLTPKFDADNAKVAPHGLIGQSYDADDLGVLGNIDSYATRGNETSTEAMGEGAIEGVASEYEMPKKFSTDFKYARFGKASAPPRDVSALTGKKIKRVNVATAKAIEQNA